MTNLTNDPLGTRSHPTRSLIIRLKRQSYNEEREFCLSIQKGIGEGVGGMKKGTARGVGPCKINEVEGRGLEEGSGSAHVHITGSPLQAIPLRSVPGVQYAKPLHSSLPMSHLYGLMATARHRIFSFSGIMELIEE